MKGGTTPKDRAWFVWLALALPLLAIRLWVLLGIGFYRPGQFAGDAAVLLAWCALTVLVSRWRILGSVVARTVAWLLYLFALVLTLAEALSFYFQASSFNGRFFANLRWGNLQSGLLAFPVLSAVTAVLLVTLLALSAWLLDRQACVGARDESVHGALKVAVLLSFLALACALPSGAHRLGQFFMSRDRSDRLVFTGAGRALVGHVDEDPPGRDQVYANPGKNLVVIYMESLERVYTEDKIFPGLTPNLDRWRAKGLDFSGFLTFTGADYTMAGIFASQCGAPYLPSPARALALGGNNANAGSFQPTLACLGDILHAAGYEQTYMNGARLSFADKGTFFHMHGFDHVLGLDELEKQNDDKLPSAGWGLYDSDLFRLAVEKFDALAAGSKPFNLQVLTVDDHPQAGRLSPGCPKYAANPNSMLQAVHCTDYLVGKFLDTISRNPAWKNTIVVVMSDHLAMRNVAEPLYPKSYKRRPLMFILNAGQGRRDMRFYHMDIAPTVLHLMGVTTNARFIAGSDRSEPGAPDSPLENNATDLAVLRQVLWARAQPLVLCKHGVLIGAADNGVKIGGYPVPMSWRGRRRVGMRPDGAWVVSIDPYAVHGTVLNDADGLPLDEGGVAARLATRAGDESVLLVHPEHGGGISRQFSVDWIGKQGGRTHLADVPRLRGLEISSPRCSSSLKRMDALPSGATLDLSRSFKVSTAPLYPPLAPVVWFDKQGALPYERELGWMKPEVWGSYTVGDHATVGFTLPREHCHSAAFDFKVHPYVAATRPKLDVAVYANGALMTTWHFGKPDSKQTWHHVTTPVRTPDPQCRVDLEFVFKRPGAPPPPYPEDEDRRPLQLLFLSMELAPAQAALANAAR